MGSNLTLYCNVENCPHQTDVYLEIAHEKERVLPFKFINCTAIFSLTNVREPLFNVFCKMQHPGTDYYVTGITLQSGLPPGKPFNISCETTRSAEFVDCKWEKRKNTHVPTTYNISVNIENGSLIYSLTMQEDKAFSIPPNIFGDNLTYLMTVFAHNHFGQSRSDPLIFTLSDIVIPERPNITQIDFKNGTLVAVLGWETTEPSTDLEPFIRVQTANKIQIEANVLNIGNGFAQISGLRALTNYEFQVKICRKKFHQHDDNSPTLRKRVCSKWSQSFLTQTPGKGPSQALHVWRDSVITMKDVVTVVWEPLPSHDYSGAVCGYEVFLGDGQKQNHNCCSATVPLLQPISVTAVTSYGTSPPATVPLTQSDSPGPVLRAVTPWVNGSAVTVSWTEQRQNLLSYVTEWTTLPPTALHWKTVSKELTATTITGLMPGIRYNISVYAVTTNGVTAPSSSVVYSKELQPQGGPDVQVLEHETNRVLVKWDELPLEKRRGFITSYTIYYHVLDSSSPQLNVSVPASMPRQRWLDCPEGTLALQMSASTAAGEGPRDRLISSHPPTPAVNSVIVIIFIITFFIAIIANLMCWKCVRKRIKQQCIAWSPQWLGDNLPKLKNSNAIKLLELDKSEPSLFSLYSDPPLSPITCLSHDELYPSVHEEIGPLHIGATAPESTNDTYNSSVTLDHCSYKPQTAAFCFLMWC
uniref:Fibronectin type-III domain-containing protein n=1 Tax=Knipowitschia caucasica TaxID=637954 RepID=A0AAV2KS94_KNICA